MQFGDNSENGVKSEKFLKVNPNGRVPALVDGNEQDFVVWEVSCEGGRGVDVETKDMQGAASKGLGRKHSTITDSPLPFSRLDDLLRSPELSCTTSVRNTTWRGNSSERLFRRRLRR